jgi:tRNA-intron endonuclease
MDTMEVKRSLGVLAAGAVTIPRREDADPLLQGGYGTRCDAGEGVLLSPWEALYLLAEDRLQVSDVATGDALGFQTLLSTFREDDPEVWTRYLIYRDLRKRGYVVRDGMGLGIDFRLYARGTYGEKAAKYIVYAVCEGTPVPVQKLQEALSIALNVKKRLVVAVMDRRGEIVYYSLGTFS